MKDFLISVVIFSAVVLTALLVFGGDTTVGVTQDGECKWIEAGPNFERRECPAELPATYNRVIVSEEE